LNAILTNNFDKIHNRNITLQLKMKIGD